MTKLHVTYFLHHVKAITYVIESSPFFESPYINTHGHSDDLSLSVHPQTYNVHIIIGVLVFIINLLTNEWFEATLHKR